MRPYELIHLLAQIKKLPENQLHRVIEAAKEELLERTRKRKSVPARPWKKG